MNTPCLMELSHVSKIYDPSGNAPVQVLDDISIQVAAGESVAVVGPSGSGKTTLLNIMGALDLPSSGQVRLDGEDIDAMPETELAGLRNRKVGFVFQLHHLLPQCTVLENVLVPTLIHPNPTGADGRARALLERVELGHRLTHLPGQLSGGERQRVALVRALMNKPRLLLADEPTGSLDRKATESLADLLGQLNKEEATTLVVVTHSEQLAARMGRTLRLLDGKLEA